MRLFLYLTVWVYAQLASVFGTVAFATLVLFYTTIGPLACIWTGARVGLWAGLGTPGAYVLMMVGVWLFGTVRLPLLDMIIAALDRIRSHMRAMELLGTDLWRQYRIAQHRPGADHRFF